MLTPDAALVQETDEFAQRIVALLAGTVCDDPPISAEVGADGRVVVAPRDESGTELGIPLTIAGVHRLDLRLLYRCTWDFTGRFLAVSDSSFALALPGSREPLVRFDYQRDRTYSPAHVQVHAESSALGYLLAWQPWTKPPKVQRLHLPVGGRRFRPALEDVIEFAIHDLAVEPYDGWRTAIQEGRDRWRRVQLAAALRDVIKDDPDTVPDELRRAIDDARRAVVEHRRPDAGSS